MAWLYLLVAGLLEIAWAVGLKLSQGFSRPLPTAFTIVTMIGSFVFLSLAMRSLPLGTAYAIWTGIGAIGTATLGIFLFDESAAAGRLVCIVLIVAGIVGLKLTSSAYPTERARAGRANRVRPAAVREHMRSREETAGAAPRRSRAT